MTARARHHLLAWADRHPGTASTLGGTVAGTIVGTTAAFFFAAT